MNKKQKRLQNAKWSREWRARPENKARQQESQKKYYTKPVNCEKRRIRVSRWRLEDPESYKEYNRISMKKYREKQKETNQEYNRSYQQKYLENPVHLKSHYIRTGFSSGGNRKVTILKIPGLLEYVRDSINKAEIKNPGKKICINHIISIPLFYEFDIEMSKEIICDEMNIEAITKEENSEKRNYITDEVFEVARKLIAKYPKELRGFMTFLQGKKIEIDMKRVGSRAWRRTQKAKIENMERKIA